jgi:hypothetical protein
MEKGPPLVVIFFCRVSAAPLVRNESGMTWRLLSLGGRETIKADARQACFIEWCLTCSADPREESLDGK